VGKLRLREVKWLIESSYSYSVMELGFKQGQSDPKVCVVSTTLHDLSFWYRCLQNGEVFPLGVEVDKGYAR